MVFVFLFQPSLCVIFFRSLHVSTNDSILFFYGWVIFHCVCVCVCVCVHTHHILFIHSSVHGHLGYFHILAVVSSADMNSGVHISFWIMIFSAYMPSSEMPGSYSSFFSFQENFFVLFSIVAVSVYTPTSSAWGFSFLHTLSSVYCV